MKSLRSRTHCECTNRFQLLMLFSEEISSESNSTPIYSHPPVFCCSNQDTLRVLCSASSADYEFILIILYPTKNLLIILKPVPVAARSKAWVYGRSFAGIVGFNPVGRWMFVCCECRVLSRRGLCVGLITCPEEFYRVWCVNVITNPR
jgi:hypothetical protein